MYKNTEKKPRTKTGQSLQSQFSTIKQKQQHNNLPPVALEKEFTPYYQTGAAARVVPPHARPAPPIFK
jgi:hypothetical protein